MGKPWRIDRSKVLTSPYVQHLGVATIYDGSTVRIFSPGGELVDELADAERTVRGPKSWVFASPSSDVVWEVADQGCNCGK